MSQALVITAAHVVAAIESVANGASLTAAAQKLGVKRQSLYAAIKRTPGALEAYDDARVQASDAMAEEIISIADREPDANKARVRVDARKWVASKWQPSRYGEKLDLSVNHQIDLKGAIALGRARAEARAGIRGTREPIEDATIVEPAPLPSPSDLPDIFS